MSTTAVEQLEQGKKRLEALNARRQRAQVQLEAGRQQLAEARKEALAWCEANKDWLKEKGIKPTDDLNELKKILAQQETENTQAVGEFLKAVTEFESFIGRIEEALTNPVAMASLLASMPEPEPEAAPVAAPAPAFASEDI